METRLQPSKCPRCGAVHDAASGVNNDAAPAAGDVAVCFKCGAINKFAPDLLLQPMSAEELQDPALAPAFKAQREIRQLRGLAERGPRL